jgi:hypothetical protein
MMKPEVRRKVARWSTWLALAVAVVVAAWFLTRPQRVVVELESSSSARPDPIAQAVISATGFRVNTNGDSSLYDTLKATSSDGLNTWIGNGGRFGVVNVVGTYTASRNISLGNNALLSNIDGYDNIAIGVDSLKNLVGINAGLGANQGHDNIAIGDHAMEQNLIGETNIAIGGNALAANQLTRNSVAIGFNALAASTAQENIAIGTNAMLHNVSGTQNIAIGVTLINNVSGVDNIVMGHDSMGSCVACNDNIAIGVDVLQNNNSVQNVGIGTFALRVNTGFNNVGIGIAAGFQSTSGHDNTFVGSSTGGGIVAGTSNTIIGANVTGLAAGTSNNVIIADGDGNIRLQDNGGTLYTLEKVGIGGATAPAYTSNAQNWIISGVAGTTTDQLTVDSESITGNTSDLNSITIHNSGTFNTTAASKNAIGLRIVVDPTASAGGNLLNNVGLPIDTNTAIHVIHGTTQIDELLNAANAVFSSTVHVVGDFDVNTSKFTVQASSGNVEAIGLVTLSNTTESLWTEGRTYLGGNVKGDTVYVSGGSINFGYEQNTTDHLFLNFTGYHGAFAQARDLRISDGMGDQIWTVEGGTGHIVQTGEGHTAPSGGAGCTSGGGGSITGTDNNFRLITGGTSTSCTVSFGASWGTAPVCTIYPSAGTTLPTCTISATAITCTVNLASTTYNVQCEGVPGSV